MKFQIRFLPAVIARRAEHGQELQTDLMQIAKILKTIQVDGSLISCALTMNLSYRTLWDLIRGAEEILSFPLLKKTKGRGSILTNQAEQLLNLLEEINGQSDLIKQEIESKVVQSIKNISNIKLETFKPRIFMSNDPLLEDFLKSYQGVEFKAMSSSQALERLMNRECEIAGFYVDEEQSIQEVRTQLSNDNLIAIPVMIRIQGIILAKGNPWRIKKIQDLARPEIRFINRQKGTGSRLYVEQLLQKTGLDSGRIHGLSEEEFTQIAVAYAVISGVADAGMGLQYIAQASGLDFIALSQETYFLAMNASMSKRHLTKDLIKKLRSKADLTIGYQSLKLRNSRTK